MVSDRLRSILWLTAALIFLHVVEEVVTGFQDRDIFFAFPAGLLPSSTAALYWGFHAMWLLLVVVGVLLITNPRRWTRPLLMAFGLIFVVELHHLVKALLAGQYYPGMITASLYPVVGVFYWKEVLKVGTGA